MDKGILIHGCWLCGCWWVVFVGLLFTLLTFLKEIPNQEHWLVDACAVAHSWLCQIIPRNASASAIATNNTDYFADLSEDKPTILSEIRVLDVHTPEGKNHADGLHRFALLGSLVVRDNVFKVLPSIIGAKLTRSYIVNKLITDTKKKGMTFEEVMNTNVAKYSMTAGLPESLLLKLECRAQLTCSNHRPDTYLAYLWGFPVFVKGPFAQDTQVSIEQVHQVKEKLGLGSVRPYIFSMVPDMWDEVPIGLRMKLDRTKPCKFIVQASLIPEEGYPLPKRVVSSKV